MPREKETLENAFGLIVEEILKAKVNVAVPALVTAFDGRNRITAQPVVNRRFRGKDPKPLPPIEDVPVLFPGAGLYWMTFPVDVGSFVMLIASQRSIDAWKNSLDGAVGDASTPRKFSMSDAVAIPGILPFVQGFDVGSGLQLRDKTGNVRIQIDGTEITVTNTLGTFTIDATGKVDVNGHLTVEP